MGQDFLVKQYVAGPPVVGSFKYSWVKRLSLRVPRRRSSSITVISLSFVISSVKYIYIE